MDADEHSAPPPPVGETVTELYQQLKAELHRFGNSRLRPGLSTQDMVQEIFLQFVRFRPQEGVRDTRAYLFKIAWHIVHRFNRREARAAERMSHHEFSHLETVADSQPELWIGDACDELSFREQFNQVLNELPGPVQAALLLYKRDGLSHKEIARRLGLSVNTVTKYIGRAVLHFSQADWSKS
jgi:RNA polymerase sigma factor (sigma-70 family)